MSAAQSDLDLAKAHEDPTGIDTPRHRALPGSSLEVILAASDKPLIAVDMDDVLSETNQVVAECMSCFFYVSRHLWITSVGHNDAYGTTLDLTQFYCEYTVDPCKK